MQLLKTIREFDVHPDAPETHIDEYSERHAARAIVLDDEGRVALLRVNKYSYHKLPGGGVEADEDMRQALKRELREEIGCEAEVMAEVGEIIEYRDQWSLRQTSDCYLARKVGEQVSPDFDEGELADDFEMLWVDSIDEAIQLLEGDTPTNYDGDFIHVRDLILLRAAKELIK